ncbi:MAG: efflux RND transporter periplasmic adaptor subunit [bacterium]
MKDILTKIDILPRLKVILRKKQVYIPLVVVILIFLKFFVFGGGDKTGFEIQTIELAKVTHVVSETGTVEPGQDISLSFARSGRVSNVLVKKGDTITKGQTLAYLETGSLNADLRQAIAALELEKASIAKTDVALENAKQVLSNALTDAYITADDVVQAKADQLFKNPESNNPGFGISITSSNSIYYIEASSAKSSEIDSLRSDVEIELNSFEKMVFGGSIENIEEATLAAENTLQNIQKLLTLMASILNEYVAENTTVQTIYEGYKTDISSARSSLNTTLTTLRSALQSYYTARVSVETKVGINSSTAVVQLQDIRIEDALARVAGIRSQINDAYIVSPITGLVTNVLVSAGEVAGASSPSISVISSGDLEISVNIPEDDIAYIDVGDRAHVTFDAYDNTIFEAEVIYISPRAVELDGVPVFEVVLQFQENDKRIKAGLSVDVNIIAEEREGVISVPSRAVIEEGNDRFVRVMVNGNSYRRAPVTLGLKGDDGRIEVTGGLEIGDRVIAFVDDEKLLSFNEIE